MHQLIGLQGMSLRLLKYVKKYNKYILIKSLTRSNIFIELMTGYKVTEGSNINIFQLCYNYRDRPVMFVPVHAYC